MAASPPLSRYIFYFDLKNSPHVDHLTDMIQKLGGRIHPFLNAKVNVVITNKPKTEWSRNEVTDSPTPNLIKSNTSFSRGKMLLERAAQNQPKTSDTLELARKLNIKIYDVNKVLQICRKYFDNTPEMGSRSGEAKTRYRNLMPPYIKIMDNSMKYRTSFKELNEWPEINFDFNPELCPFYKRRVTQPARADTPGPNQTSVSHSTKSTALLRGLNEKCTALTTPILTTTPTTNQARSIPANPKTTKRRHTTYCEICHKEYTDFEQHLSDESHASFLSNEENFEELLSVIQSLPPFFKEPSRRTSGDKKGLMDMTNLPECNSEQTSKECEQSEHSMMAARKSVSPPTRSIHAINWSSASKHSFVAIHDLINRNESTHCELGSEHEPIPTHATFHPPPAPID